MSGLLYAEGYFPFQVPEKDKNGDAFQEWDGVTKWYGYPSRSSGEYIPVVGDNTLFPLKLTLEQALEVYWRVERWKLTADASELIITTVPSATASGGGLYQANTSPPPEWKWIASPSATVEELTAPQLDIGIYLAENGYIGQYNEYGEPIAPIKHKAKEKSLVCYWPYIFAAMDPDDPSSLASEQFGDGPAYGNIYTDYETDSNSDSQNGNEAANSVTSFMEFGYRMPQKGFLASGYSSQNSLFIKSGEHYYLSLELNVRISINWSKGTTRRLQEGDAPGVTYENTVASSYFDFVSYNSIASNATKLTTLPVVVQLTLSNDQTVEANFRSVFQSVSVTNMPDPPDGLLTGIPKICISADKYWTYGGIYNENTGAKV